MDFDGTIYDSSSLNNAGRRIVEIVNKCGHKIPENIYVRLKDNWGTGGTKMIADSFGLDLEIAKEIYHEWWKIDLTDPFPLIQGLKETLITLESRQIKILILTNRHRKNLTPILNHFCLARFFDFIQTMDDWAFSKPDPHTFCFVLHQLAKSGILSKECVYVGDTIMDFECTSARGLTSVSVTTGVFNEPDFVKAGQKKENIIRSIADLPEWIEKYNKTHG